MERREFLKKSGIGVGSLLLNDILELSKTNKPIGVQIWSVREDMKKDPTGVLSQLSKMGYQTIEGANYENRGFYGFDAKKFKKILQDRHLKIPSGHYSVLIDDYNPTKNEISDRWKKLVEDALVAGHQYIIHPWMGPEDRVKANEWATIFNHIGEYCHSHGIRFGYHNHDFEFVPGKDGRLMYEVLLYETDPKYVCFEMDLYWVTKAGYDPVDWFQRAPGRFELCHIKDMAGSEKKETIEIGDGVINFQKIFNHQKEAGLKHFIVELEDYKTTPMEGVSRCIHNLKKLQF